MPKDGPLYALHSNGTVASGAGGGNSGTGSNHVGNNNNNNVGTDHVYRVFSVDDDPDEIEHDIRYLEGLHDGLKCALHGAKTKNHQNAGISNSTPTLSAAGPSGTENGTGISDEERGGASGGASELALKPQNSSKQDVAVKSPSKTAGQSEVDPYTFAILDRERNHNRDNSNNNSESHGNDGEDYEHPDDYLRRGQNIDAEDGRGFDRHSNASSLESFTLRERQDAINETHPFGIRIWKPALYKKQRSVQKVAAEDIHETTLKKITWQVQLTNIIWCITMGLALFSFCYCVGAVVCTFGFFTKSSRQYASFLFKLAKYLFWPFGKIVYLTQEKQYLEEDRDEGISAQQFYNWATSYSNRLFFHRSQAEDSNSLINKSNSKNNTVLQHPSYGSIREHLSATNQTSSRHGTSTPILRDTENNEEYLDSTDENNAGSAHRRYFGRGKWTWGRIVFYSCFHLVLQPFVLILTLITWLFVFTIPMSNILWNLLYHIRRHPLAMGFKSIKNTTNQETPIMKIKKTNVLLCTFRCAGWHYYKFTVDGTNIIVVNLLFLVFFTIVDFYFLKQYLGLKSWINHDTTVFALCLASIIPLAFYIGQAVASISAQTSMGLGAVINAFFSTVVEIFLYCVALKQGKGLLVEGSMIGSILGAVLLLPGLSMCGGALNRKTQRYNPASAGVSSAMLIFSMIVMFVPTILYQIYGGYEINCNENIMPLSLSNVAMAMSKKTCYFSRPPLKFTKMYVQVLEPISVSCAIVLFLAYIVGLWFTLRTHAVVIWQLPISDQAKDVSSSRVLEQNADSQQESAEENGGHESPNWSRGKSTFVLLFATISYAIIAEILVSCVDTVLEDIPSLNPKFLGLTIFALVPNTTEFLNAISFAIHGNVALSMEIGSAYALQVCLLQIPALVVYSILYTWNVDHSTITIRDSMFALVFPNWDLIACMASVFMFTYLYAEGKSNYFKGSMLILLYIITVLGFYFQGVIDGWNISQDMGI